MLQPETPTVVKLFSNGIQFEIPVYQRAYVWTAEVNWEPLWQDVVDTVARYTAAPDGGEGLKHFLGPIVLHQRNHAVGGIERRTVIDGQQRLTTLQLLLAAVRRVADEHGCTDVVDELTSLLENRGRGADGPARQKIRPSRRDREHFLRALATTDVDDCPATGPLGAFAFFHRSVHVWLTDGEVALPTDPTQRLTVLQDTILDLLFVVAINLEDADNPQIIFETLNARGTALGALDLVKNALFAELEQHGNRAVELHDELWEPTFEAVADEGYWSKETEQGRRSWPRSSWFLMHWLAAELGTVVRADRLYETFRRDVLRAPGTEAADLVRRLCRDAGTIRSFDDLPVHTVEGRFFARLRSLDTTTMHPVALLLFRSVADGVLTAERRELALSALESWLVRRSILRLTSQSYNRILAAVLAAAKSDPASPDLAVIDALRSNTARTSRWPDDEELRGRLESAPLYGYLGTPRLRMLLEACELDLRSSDRTEDIALPPGLSVEHILPQSWETNWPLPHTGADSDERAADRDSRLHRLGNLTLVTQPLNAHLSNAPWTSSDGGPSKRRALSDHSLLLLNRDIAGSDRWDEDTIEARGRTLADRILRTWPGPTDPRWTDG
ncbi:DUF262 domain-containing protein [Pseudonocardia alni]|uniref:DUF262 domain-containing protein n=1 Tax=Pseudonocardia alni TaxID=33907 RepID=UPI001AD7003B|nr:DUF262 domain-containing protein [Pseudonocardia alni]MBO4238588.1 DUF262 domain-containing protein [Pseudonocardia alni]